MRAEPYELPGAACGLLKNQPASRSIPEYDLRVTCAAARHASHRYERFRLARRTGHRSRGSRAAADFSTLTRWTRDFPFRDDTTHCHTGVRKREPRGSIRAAGKLPRGRNRVVDRVKEELQIRTKFHAVPPTKTEIFGARRLRG